MKKIYRMIEHFEMMGYEVKLYPEFEMIEVRIRTDRGYGAGKAVYFHELEKDFVVEYVVRELNEWIIRDL